MESARTRPFLSTEPKESAALFIIRFWFDDEGPAGSPTTRPRRWRGIITHPPSLRRQPVYSLPQISAYLDVHLRELGAAPPGWLARWCEQLWPNHRN